MKEHKVLKEICDKIGYESEFTYCKIVGYYCRVCDDSKGYAINREPDIREIIFTQDFKVAYTKKLYLGIDDYILAVSDYNEIIHHLENPVHYLHNRLGLGKTQNQ